MKIDLIAKRYIALLLLITLTYHVNAQGISDLGTVWSKQYGIGNIINIKHNKGSNTYTAGGAAWTILNPTPTPAGLQRLDGLIMEFSESGEVIKRAVVRIPQSYTNTHTYTRASASFKVVFKTDDGGFLAFGHLYNPDAPLAEKQPAWAGGAIADAGFLTIGFWVVKLDKDLNVIVNRLEQGMDPRNGWQTADGNFVIGGFDANNTLSHTGTSIDITLLRKYNQAGVLITNARANHREINSFYKFPTDDSFIAVTPDKLLRIDANLNITAGSLPAILSGHATVPYANSISPAAAGGMFIRSALNSNANGSIQYTNGFGFFKLNSTNAVSYAKIDKPAAWTYSAPLLLPGTNNPLKYVGVASNCGTNLAGCTNYIYELTDDGTFNYRVGTAYPDNTILNAISKTDGFFSCGTTTTGQAAIAKLSTCANFKASPVTDIYVPYANSVNIAQAINYVGAKASAISGVKYTLQTKVVKGKVNGTTVGGILETVPLTQVAGFISVAGSASGKILDLNRTYNLDSNLSHAEIEVTLTIQDNFLNGGQSQSCSQTYVFKIIVSKASSTLFSDDVWFFGQNEGAVRADNTSPGTPQTSKGIIFKKEGSVMKPYDASGISKVNSWENSLSVSTPACNGSFIFYTQHNQVYNTSHLPMDGGAFSGHTSTADGLAACYVGNNKYIMFSVTAEANTGTLKYYYIDMAANNGLGKMSVGGDVETNKVQEAIELIPKVGTTNQYWLLYFDVTTNKLKVKLIDGSQANPIGAVVSELPVVSEYTYSFTANTTWDKLLAVNTPNYFDVFDFNPLTGAVVKKYQKTDVGIANYSYGGTFSPDGKYLYVATYHATNTVRQYETSTGTLMGSAVFNNTALNMGSGMKLGPDGKIYINREERKWMAVIENPNIKFGTPGGGVTMDGFALTRNGYGLRPSTGLTPPWVNPSSANTPPNTVKDLVTTTTRWGTLFIKPLLNDIDNTGRDALNLSGAEFANPADASKGTLSWSATTKEVTFTPNPLHNFANGDKILINYVTKDVGIPISLCDEGEIEITWRFVIANNDIVTALQKTPNNPIKVTLNDSIPVGCTGNVSIGVGPTHGTASVSGSTILYTPTNDYTGPDQLAYKIACGTQVSAGAIHINVIKLPDNISDAECFLKDPPASAWGIKEVEFYPEIMHTLVSPIVGDIDGDGEPEIVALLKADQKTLRVISNKSVLLKSFTMPATMDYESLAMARINTASGIKGFIYAIVGTNIYGYNYETGSVWQASYTQKTSSQKTLNIADFNNDGFAEISCGGSIYDAETGYLLCSTSGNFGYTTGWVGASKTLSFPANIIGDEKLELVAGNKIFNVNITSRTNSALNNITLAKTINTPITTACGTYTPADGTTQVVDINNDGRLDVVVQDLVQATKTAWLYAWDAKTEKLIAATCVPNVLSINIPLIGDVDGDQKPEIILMGSEIGYNTNGKDSLYAFVYDETLLFKKKWTFKHADPSGATGLTLFDFNQDKTYELIYRDEKNLRILSVVGTTLIDRVSIPCLSYTGYEHPIVVDLDGDGSAEIITIGQSSGNYQENKGPIRVFKSLSQPWAPARPVWNQYAYNAVNVNNDLTIPHYQLSPATIFPGKDGVFGTPDDVRPYNAFLQQQTTLNKNGTPLWLAPQAEIRKQPVFNYDVAKDSMTISVTVHNIGDAAFQNPFKITAYKNIVGGTPKHTYSYAGVINAGDSAVITFGIPKFKLNWTPFADIIIRANDKGNGYNDQLVCDSMKRDFKTGTVIASDDRVLVFKNSTGNIIKILENDIRPDACVTPSITTISGPKHGTVDGGTYYTYKPNSDYLGQDTIVYKIDCGGKTSIAKVIINVVSKPDNISEADCYVDPPARAWEIKPLKESTINYFAYGSPVLAGDIDGDGKVEIILNDGLPNKGTKLVILDNDLKVKYTLTSLEHFISTTCTYAIANVDGNAHAAIFIATTTTRQLKKFVLNTTTNIYDQAWSVTYSANTNYDMGNPLITDFNGDGYAEVSVYDKVFDARTGTLLVDGLLLGSHTALSNPHHFGMRGGHPVAEAVAKHASLMAAGDIDGDNLPELVGGDCVYKVTINSRTNSALNTFALLRKANNTGHSEVGDGPTSLADMDLDGHLDVVVTRNISTSKHGVYIWNPLTGDVMHSDVINNLNVSNSGDFGPSIAAIGNLDNDPYPEITFIGFDYMYAYDYDPTTKRLIQKWNMYVNDESAITLFDFNQDNRLELVYRDFTKLMILNGDNKQILTSIPCGSHTANEYPLILDINNDGHAEFVIIAGGNYAQTGTVRIYGSDTWAPARPVWNQYTYNAVNINDDLTIPRYQINPATVFPGKDGMLGTADDVRPYNAFLQQQTTLNKNGTPLWLAPQAEIRKQPIFNYDVAKDSMTISVTVHNIGDAAFQNPFKITAYKDIVGGTPKHTYSYAGVINAGDSAVITFGIPKFKLNWTPFTDIIIRANDKGNGYNDQLVCDSMKRDFKTGTVIASDDRVLVFGNLGVNKIEVLKNDIYPASCISPAVAIIPGHEPKQGTITIAGGIIHYTPKVGYKVTDTLKYRLTCGANTSDATVYIRIGDKPDNIIDPEACVVPFTAIDFKVKQQWSKRGGDIHAGVGNLVGDLDNDGIPEIVAFTGRMVGTASVVDTLKVFNGQTGEKRATLVIPDLRATPNSTGGWLPVITAVLVDADRNGKGEIILATTNGNLTSYEASTTGGVMTLNQKWTSTFANPSTSDYLPQPIVTDFNGDGVPEVLVYNQIYNAVTGHYIGQTEAIATAYMGRIVNRTGNKNSNFISVADMDGDGLPEVVAGGKVYKIDISKSGTTDFSKILFSETSIIDGFTAVADIDMDGKLDVVVVNVKGGTTQTWLHVWSPLSNTLIHQFMIYDNSTYPAQSYPFIGDIDGVVDAVTGKKYPEICVTIVNKVEAYKYNSTTKKMTSKWTLPTSDGSGGTGITLFDFNNDGINELVYRDQTLLRILNGTVDGVAPVLADANASFACLSGTAFEYPTIADTDGDGSANICITCGTVVGTAWVNAPFLRVYESGSKPWAPTRKVWNQVNYEPLQINEDLTVPRYSFPKNTVFNGKYPYNGALIQVPIVDDNFDPISLAPDPGTTAADISIERLNASMARVWITISNHGAKHTNISLPVTLYINDATVAANKIASKPVGVGIAPGAKYKMYIDIPVSRLQVAQKIVVRIQDDGTKYPADGSYLDCNYTNNVVDKPIFYAVDDYVALFTNTTVSTPVFANDKRAACTTTPLSKFDTIPNSGLKQGSLVFSQASDTSFVYTSKSGVATTDSVTYYIKCGTDSAVAKVYYLQIKPNSQAYTACPNAVVTVGVNAITGVTFRWYATATGSAVLTTGLTTTVTKDASLSQSVWVEAEYKGVKYSRIEVKVGLGDCGVTDPTDCAKDGTVIFKEDFGGNAVSDPVISAIGIGAKSEYIYTTNVNAPVFGNNKYTIAKTITPAMGLNVSWHTIIDHTYKNDPTRGYCFIVNGDTKKKVYELEINNLCSGTSLYFSLWLANILKHDYVSPVRPDIEFVIEDKNGNVITTLRTGETILEDVFLTWKQYGTLFDVPLNVTDIVFKVYSYGNGGSGNDYAIDDIEVRFCAPPVVTLPAKDTVICLGSNLDIQLGSEFIDDGTFGANIDYRWEFKAQESVIWNIITGTGGSSNNDKVTVAQSKHTIASATATNTGDYRFIIAATGNINSVNCRAVSESFHVLVAPPVRAADIRVQVCPDATPGSNLNLSSYLHVIHPQLDWNVKWGNVSATPYSPVVNSTDPKGGVSLAFATGTHTYKYKMENKCGVDSARMYITSLNTTTIQMPPQRVVICREMAENIHINQILGVEARGMITSNLTPAIANDHILNVANPSPFAGAVVFNGKTAYDDPRIIPDPYKGDVKATRVVFTYTANNASCLTQKMYTVELIITTNILN